MSIRKWIIFSLLAASACTGEPALFRVPEVECAGDWECEARELCTREGCRSAEQACVTDSDCPGVDRCAGGACFREGACYADAHCREGWACVRGQCAPLRCTSDDECTDGERCDASGACVPAACVSDDECAAGRVCDVFEGQCLPSTCEDGEARGAELCDGKDNDCNGEVDERFAYLGLECEALVGTCTATGTWVCGPGGMTTLCQVMGVPPSPSAEICNERDDDCDGVVDEGYDDLGGDCWVGMGACAQRGVLRCSDDGAATVCSAEPASPQLELCNGADDDCDGEVDEDFAGLFEPCSRGLGLCRASGVNVCAEDALSVVCSAPELVPAPEVCDGLDNDCDGDADEDFPDLGDVCVRALGACENRGTWACAADGAARICTAAAPVSAVETCNGWDDDCDGEVDEDLPGVGASCGSDVGTCALGAVECVGGQMICVGDVGPTLERCNLSDDDCDGQTDENLTCRETGEGCATHAECYGGLCAWGVCSEPCLDTPDCPSGMSCLTFAGGQKYCFDSCTDDCGCDSSTFCAATTLGNGCIARGAAPHGASCAYENDCASGTCVFGRCTETCGASGMCTASGPGCPAAWSCADFVGSTDYCLPACATSADCDAGWYCHPQGVCVLP